MLFLLNVFLSFYMPAATSTVAQAQKNWKECHDTYSLLSMQQLYNIALFEIVTHISSLLMSLVSNTGDAKLHRHRECNVLISGVNLAHTQKKTLSCFGRLQSHVHGDDVSAPGELTLNYRSFKCFDTLWYHRVGSHVRSLPPSLTGTSRPFLRLVRVSYLYS